MTKQQLPIADVTSDYLTEPDAARILGISRSLLTRLRQRGAIAHVRFAPRCVRYTPAQLTAYRAAAERPQTNVQEGR